MSLKVLVFLACACVCVVKASVFIVQISTADEPEESQSTVNNRECDHLCRRLGFTGGDCISGRCKCDNVLDNISNENPSVDNNGAHNALPEEPNIAESELLRSCYFRECDQRCRRLGFTGGACINGRCKCDNFLENLSNETPFVDNNGAHNALPGTPNVAESELLRSCYFRECDQRCRRLGFTGGACINGRCKCDNFLENISNETPFVDNNGAHNEIPDEPNVAESELQRSCYFRECDQRCRRLGFTGGDCISGRCKCDNFLENLSNETPFVDNNGAHNVMPDEPNVAESKLLRSCYFRECDQRCRRLGFTGGACINGRCKCDNFKNMRYSFKGNLMIFGDHESLSCIYGDCLRWCQRMGYLSGNCIGGKCKCLGRQNVDNVNKKSLRNCNQGLCTFVCRLLGKNGGSCMNGICQCY